jgi:exopolysaccharide biosynthesis polyprenyl glycosylphosphotransferase
MERQSLTGRPAAGNTKERAETARQLPPVGTGAKPPPAPRRLATRMGLTGPHAARRRGGVLRRLLAIADWTALLAALCIATMSSRWIDVGTLFWAVIFSPAWILVLKLQGLYDHDHRRIRHSTLDELPRLVSACVLGTLAIDGLLSISPAHALGPSGSILVGILALTGSFFARGAVRLAWHRATGTANGVVIGSGEAAEIVARRVATHPEARLRIVGYLGPEDGSANTRLLPRLGSLAEIAGVAHENEVERVVVAGHDFSEEEAERLIEACKTIGLALTFLPRHYKLLGPGIELNRLAELPVLDFRFSDPPRSTMLLKRGLDIVVSAGLLILLSPLFLLISLMILLDTGRPVFFRQIRAGRDGEPFTMIKFRTMVSDAEQRLRELVDIDRLDEPVFKIRNDPRVTRVGRVLRRTSLDELPQFINVLRGDMSLVGPRPEEEAVVALYDDRQRMRLSVKPGLTGPMQVYGRGDLTFEERLALERDYLDNLSVTGDLAILMRTPAAVMRGHGAY